MNEWYRRKVWTDEDEIDFFERLFRAREFNRPQYLRIQAVELINTDDKGLLTVARSLLNKLLKDYPENKSEKSITFKLLGDTFRLNGELDVAMNYYYESIKFEKLYPNVQTDSYLQFSEIAVKINRAELYEEAEKMLEQKFPEQIFPLEKYKTASILSIINYRKQNLSKAEYYADIAEQNASLQTSGLQYHKNLGIVKERDKILEALIKRK